MSMFNKVLASIGIGSAVVDTIVEEQALIPGQRMNGIIRIIGGNVEQKIDSIYLSLKTFIVVEYDDRKMTKNIELKKIRLTETIVISPKETKEIPFELSIPFCTPISLHNSSVWLSTVVDVKNAVDPKDTDYLVVNPNPIMEEMLSAIKDLGFRTKEVTNEKAPRFLQYITPIVQEFEFVPRSGRFRGKLDELELIMVPESDDKLLVYLEIDRKARGFSGFLSEVLETDETNVHFTVTSQSVRNVRNELEAIISRYC